MENQPIGYIVGGGLKENFRVRLTVPPQEVQEGGLAVVSPDLVFRVGNR